MTFSVSSSDFFDMAWEAMPLQEKATTADAAWAGFKAGIQYANQFMRDDQHGLHHHLHGQENSPDEPAA